MMRLFRALLPLLILTLAAQATMAANIVYLVRTGTDSEGNAMFRQADSRDTYLAGLFSLTQSSSALSEVSRYYDQVQRDKIAASLQARGLSQADQAYAMQNVQSDPVYIEVNNSTAGAYNDWKGRFSIQAANGQVSTISAPRVVFSLGSDVARSGNSALIEQTLVHEIGHGVMCKCHTAANLPNSPYLSKPHSGGSVTDPQLAFIEGWAEFIGAYFTGRRTIAEDPANAIDTNWYAKKADGSYKSAQELLSTEGYTATVLYKISTVAKDQNAMWKMTQAMSRSSPQSMWELLQRTAQMFPELTPAMNQVLAETSGGQIQGVAAVQQAAASGQSYVNYVSPQDAANAAASGQGRTDQLSAALYGDAGAQYAGYNQYANGQAAGVANGAAGAAQDTRQLEQMYLAKRQELDAVPWWKFWEKSRIKKELTMIEDVYARQMDMTSAYQQPTVAAAAPSTYVPSAPENTSAPAGTAAAPATTYNSLVDSLRSNNSAAAQAAMDAHRRANAARNAQRRLGPQSER